MGTVEEQNMSVIYKLVEAFNNQDREAFDLLCQPDCHQHTARQLHDESRPALEISRSHFQGLP